jgi:hypothetical protein
MTIRMLLTNLLTPGSARAATIRFEPASLAEIVRLCRAPFRSVDGIWAMEPWMNQFGIWMRTSQGVKQPSLRMEAGRGKIRRKWASSVEESASVGGVVAHARWYW